MTETDMSDAFRSEVLQNGSGCTLPSSLNDHWLDRLSAQAEVLLETHEDGQAAEAIVAVLQILSEKNPEQQVSISTADFLGFLEQYRIELALEQVRRATEIEIPPATIETIFTERNLDVSLKESH